MSIDARREILLELLEDPHPAVQRVANTALERLDALGSFDGLMAELRSNDLPTQVQAIYGLGRIPGDRALRVLAQALRHPRVDIAAAAARVLTAERDPRLLKPFVEALPQADPVVQGQLVEALGALRDRRAVAPILAIVPGLDGEALERALQALGRLGDPASEPLLIEYTRSEQPRIRAAAALALGSLAADSE